MKTNTKKKKPYDKQIEIVLKIIKIKEINLLKNLLNQILRFKEAK
jgi:hypothetical protein